MHSSVQFSSVHSLSHFQLFATPWIAARQASLSITNSWSLLKLMSIESVRPSSHLILCGPLLLLPSIPPSSESFPVSQLFAWGGQSIGVSALASVLSMNTQDWSPLEWTGWISLHSISGQFNRCQSRRCQPISLFIPPPLSPWCLYLWPLCLCLYFWFENQIIYTIFIDYTYFICIWYLFLSFWQYTHMKVYSRSIFISANGTILFLFAANMTYHDGLVFWGLGLGFMTLKLSQLCGFS